MAPVPERSRRVKRGNETLRLRSGTGAQGDGDQNDQRPTVRGSIYKNVNRSFRTERGANEKGTWVVLDLKCTFDKKNAKHNNYNQEQTISSFS